MSGRHNYAALSNSLAPLGPAQMTAINAFWDQRVGESAANAAAFPTYTDRPVGHLITAEDTGAVYRRGASGWVLALFPQQSFAATWSGVTLGGGGTVVSSVAVAAGFAFVSSVVTLGSSPTVSDPTLSWSSLPSITSGASLPDIYPVGDVVIIDTSAGGAGRYMLNAYKTGTGARSGLPGTNGLLGNITTIPGGATWAAGDQIVASLRYPV